jgi:hypothetical protein
MTEPNEKIWAVFDNGVPRRKGPIVWEMRRSHVARFREALAKHGYRLVGIVKRKVQPD